VPKREVVERCSWSSDVSVGLIGVNRKSAVCLITDVNKNRRFGVTYRLSHQGEMNQGARNNVSSN
jgi:hypothetical protein